MSGHKQTAIEAGAKVLHRDYTSEYEYGPWEKCDQTPFLTQASDVIQAAQTHLRAAWEQPIRELHTTDKNWTWNNKPICEECSHIGQGTHRPVYYPCPTIQQLDKKYTPMTDPGSSSPKIDSHQIDPGLDTDRLEALISAATPGPWVLADPTDPQSIWFDEDNYPMVVSNDSAPHNYAAICQEFWDTPQGIANAKLVVTAVNELPNLIAEIRRLQATNNELQATANSLFDKAITEVGNVVLGGSGFADAVRDGVRAALRAALTPPPDEETTQ